MPDTTQPTLKNNLLTALKARSGLAGVQVTWGYPKAPQKEILMLGDIKGEQVSAMLGALKREEKYKLEVTIKVEKGGSDQQATSTRAYAIAAELEDQLRTDPTVSGAVRVAQVGGATDDPGRYQLEEFAGDSSRMAVLTIDVACSARI